MEAKSELVHQCGKTSNRLMQLIEGLQGMAKLLKCPEAQAGKYFRWEISGVAA